MNKYLKLTDTESISKLLLLLELDELPINNSKILVIDEKTSTTAGSMSFLNQNNLPVTLTETKYFDEQANTLEVSASKISLADLSELLNLNPHYNTVYQLLEFSNVKLYASASESHDNEYLTIEGTVLSENENKWHFLGIDVDNPLPLKDLKLAVTLTHKPGSFKKNYHAVVHAKLFLEEDKPFDVELTLPVGQNGAWSLRLLPPGIAVSFNSLKKLVQGTSSLDDLPDVMREKQNDSTFTLTSFGIRFDPGVEKDSKAILYSIDFSLKWNGIWNIIEDKLALNEVRLSLAINREAPKQYSYSGSLFGSAQIGTGTGALTVTADIPLPLKGICTLSAQSIPADSATQLDQFTELLGNESLGNHFPEKLDENFTLTLKKLRLLIDLTNKKVTEFQLSVASQKSQEWVFWEEGEKKLSLTQFDLDFTLRNKESNWQIACQIQGSGTLINKYVSVQISKTYAGPWKVALISPVTFGFGEVTTLTGVDLNKNEPSLPLPAPIEEQESGAAITLRKFQLHLQKTSVPYLAVYVETKGKIQIVSQLYLLEAACVLNLNDPFDASQKKVTGQIGGKIIVDGHPITMIASKDSTDAAWKYQGKSEPGDEISVTGLFEKLLPEVNQSSLPEIKVKNLELSYKPTKKLLTFSCHSSCEVTESISANFTITLEKKEEQVNFNGAAKLRIGQSLFTVTAHYENSGKEGAAHQNGWNFSGNTESTVVVSDFLGEILGSRLIDIQSFIPESFQISNAAFTSIPKTKAFSLKGEAEIELHITKNLPLALKASLDMKRAASEPKQEKSPLRFAIEAEGKLTLGQKEGLLLDLKGKYISGTNGWLLTGSNSGVFRLDSLLQDLNSIFSTEDTHSLPDSITGLDFNKLSVSLNTATKDFSFALTGNLTLGHFETVFKLNVKIIQQQDKSFQKHFSGHIELGEPTNPTLFNVIFDQSNADSILLASYNKVNGETISLQQLLASDDTPDLTFSLHDAIWAYKTQQAPIKYQQTLFSTNLGTGLNLSNLPLIGKFFDEEETLQLDYQLTIANKKPQPTNKVLFSKTELEEVNKCIPEGIAALPLEDITALIALSAALKLGEQVVPLSLPIATKTENSSSTEPNTSNEPESTANRLPVKVTNETSDDGIKWYALQKKYGPAYFNRIGMKLDGSDLQFLLDASLAVSGLTISLDGLSVTSPLTTLEPVFELKGLGIDFQKGAFEIGGALLHDKENKEYNGYATLSLKKLTLSAIGSYTELEQQPSMFFYAALNYPLGGVPCFFITGLACGFGYNRKLLLPDIETVENFPLIQDAKHSVGNAKQPVDLSKKLEELKQYIPHSIGDMFVALGIQFTSFNLVNSFALTTLSWRDRFSLDLLGISTLQIPSKEVLPTGKSPLVYAEMALRGSFIPDEGSLRLKAQLTSNSYVFSKDCHLTGGFAAYTWFSGEHAGDFVTTLGGYHPDFNIPVHYPRVPRLGMNWIIDKLSIKGEAYFALCSHAVMAGSLLQAIYKDGNVKAEFKAGMDFILAWQPYHYDARIYAHLNASYTYDAGWFGTHDLSLEIGGKFHIWGPDFAGKARLDFGIISLDVKFGDQRAHGANPLEWKEFKKAFLPTKSEEICSIAVTKGLIAEKNELYVISPDDFVLTLDSVIPVSKTSFSSMNLDGANTTFGIGSMDKSKVESTQTITITKDDTSQETHFTFEPIKKNVPAALWGSKKTPALNDERLIKNVVTGFVVKAKKTDSQLNSIRIDTANLKPAAERVQHGFAWEGGRLHDPSKITSSTQLNQILSNSAQQREDFLRKMDLDWTVDVSDNVMDHYYL
jgi:hypothetical protein